jgi:hypothetical protein
MNKEIKLFAEDIIRKFKSTNSGIMYQTEFTSLFNNDHKMRLSLGRVLIDDLKLIDRIGNDSLRLTDKGWEFESFEKIEQRRIEKEKLENDIAKSNLAANKLNEEIEVRNIKNEKYNHIATWINIVLGLANVCILLWQIFKK